MPEFSSLSSLSSTVFALTLLLSLLDLTKCLVPQATSVSVGHSIRYESLLAANNDRSTTAFIPRCKADLEEILLSDASDKLRDGNLIDQSTAKYAKAIHVLPFHYTVSGYSGNLIEDYVTPYFMNSYRIVSLGDTFTTRGGEWAPQFKIVSIEGYQQQDGESYIVGPNTKIVRVRGVVEETGQNRESQFQDGSARPFHVNTVSDIPSDVRADESYNRLFTHNLENKNTKMSSYKKTSLLMESGESTQDAWAQDHKKDFKKFIIWKYRNCLTVKDLLLATGGQDSLKFLSEKGAAAPASIILNSYFRNENAPIGELMVERGVSVAVCYSIFTSFAEEATVHMKTVTLNAMEVSLGKGMQRQGAATKKYLTQKYKNFATLKDLVKSLQKSSDSSKPMSKKEAEMPTSSVIEYFTQMHKMSFLEKMEENGISFEFAMTVLFAFHHDMRNVPVPGSGRRWPFRALIKNLITGVASLFNRSNPSI